MSAPRPASPPTALAQQAERERLFDRTVRGMSRRLASAAEPAPLFAALRWGMEQLDRTYAETPPDVLARVACRAGCGYCCSVPVDVQAHEVLFAAEHIQLHFSPVELAALLQRLGVHRTRMEGLDSAARAATMQPCSLLRDGSCSIYAGRPEACRAHHSSNAQVCIDHTGGDTSALEAFYIAPLRSRMFAVMLGMDEALEAAGHDDRAYDFGCALHEALTNSLCLARWIRHQPAFPDSCLAV